MAYDPQREDYQRLGLRFARSLDGQDPAHATRVFSTFGRRFAMDRDSLPQLDSDRAFHLVAIASRLIDYELPFATDERAREIIADGHRILDEALAIDPACYDALRMRSAADNPSFEAFLQFLNDRSMEVRSHCEARRAEAEGEESEERKRLWEDIAMRPYLRWLATQASQALICGRNKEAIRLAREALACDGRDGADVRFTAILAFAKLEDEDGLNDFLAECASLSKGRMRSFDDAWTCLARMALAFKRCDYAGALEWLNKLLKTYPHAAEALIRQNELPDGVFARLAVMPYSEDELILAISEATVLLQEGIEQHGRGVFGAWASQTAARRNPQAMLAVMASEMKATNPEDAP